MTPYTPVPPPGGAPLVIAHRGLSAKAPENTRASFTLALETTGIAMIELDVRLSKDERVIVLHDRTLQRTTTGNGRARHYTYDEVCLFDAGSWFDPRFRSERIPLLSEVLTLARGRSWVNIELKSSRFSREPQKLLERRVLEVVDQTAMGDQVLYSSFDHRLMRSLKALRPSALTGVIYNLYRDFPRSPSTLAERAGASVFVCAKHELKPWMVDDAHRGGVALYVYTLNSVSEVNRFVTWGVDGIISDNADAIVSVLESS
jgi:glycerophosphoryl diester phosphodiesterase